MIKSLSITLDNRLGKSHWQVPGPDGDFGFGGHCLPKDLSSLIHLAMSLDTETNVLNAVEETNDIVRKNRDWEQMKGRSSSMKITFIYAYENEEWSTPMALANEFKSRGWEVDFVSIGSNRTGQYHDRDLQLWIQQDLDCDVALFMDWGRFDSQWLDKKLKPNTFWVQESGDDPQNFERNFPKSERFHITLSPDSDATEEYKKRGRDFIGGLICRYKSTIPNLIRAQSLLQVT